MTCISYHPLGKMIATASADKTTKLWDMGTGQCTATLEGHIGEVREGGDFGHPHRSPSLCAAEFIWQPLS